MPLGCWRFTAPRFAAAILAALTIGYSAIGPVVAQADDLALCTDATPQFPQACACVIGRAQAADITGETLSRLLSNQVDGVPIATFQAYGAIYVQCIQEAVLGTVPGVAGGPSAPPPQVSAVPETTPLTPALPLPSVTDTDLAESAGQWRNARFPLRHDLAQLSATALTDAGRRVSLFCDPRGGAHLLLDGVTVGPGVAYDGDFSVLRGDGRQITAGGASYARVEGDHLMLNLYAAQVEALGAGSVARFTSPAHGMSDSVGLSGSGAALRALGCVDRNPYQVPPVVLEYTGDWTAFPRLPDDEYNGGLLAGIDTVVLADAGLACGDHFHLPSFRGNDANQTAAVRLTVDDDPMQRFIVELGFNRGSGVAFNALPEGFFRTIRAGRSLRVEDLRNGQGFVAVYDLSELEGALRQIDCPAEAGTQVPPMPEGWHLAPHVNAFDVSLQMLRRVDGARQTAFACYPGASLDLLIGPVSDARVLTASATLRVGATVLDVPAPLEPTGWTVLTLPAEVVTALSGADDLSVTIPSYGIDLSIPLADARAGIAALSCAAATPMAQMYPAPDPADLEFSGVDTQPWEPVATAGQGNLLVMRGEDAPGGALHIGCDGRFALSAEDLFAEGDTLPVSFSVGTEPYPRMAQEFRRDGPWWVLDAPALYADIVQAPYFAFVALTPRRPFGTYGTAGLDAARQALCR